MHSRTPVLALAGLIAMATLACTSTASQTTLPLPNLEVVDPALSVPTPVAAAPAGRTLKPLDPPLQPPVTVRIGILGLAADAGIFIAQDRGYFREQGIELEATNFQSAQQQVPLLGTGQLDVGTGAASAALLNAAAREVPIRIVADKGSAAKGFGFQGVLVRKSLVDNGSFQGCQSFKGYRVAMTAPGTSPEPGVDRLLRECGLTLSDVQVVYLAFPDMPAAFRSGAIDAANVAEPLLSVVVNDGTAVVYKTTDEYYPDQQVAVVLYGPDFIAKQRPVAERFMLAYVKALRDHWEAFTTGRGKAEIIDILTRNTTVKDPVLYQRMGAVGINPDGYVNLNTYSDDAEWWANHGQLSATIDPRQLVDNTFVDYVIDRLGHYRQR